MKLWLQSSIFRAIFKLSQTWFDRCWQTRAVPMKKVAGPVLPAQCSGHFVYPDWARHRMSGRSSFFSFCWRIHRQRVWDLLVRADVACPAGLAAGTEFLQARRKKTSRRKTTDRSPGRVARFGGIGWIHGGGKLSGMKIGSAGRRPQILTVNNWQKLSR